MLCVLGALVALVAVVAAVREWAASARRGALAPNQGKEAFFADAKPPAGPALPTTVSGVGGVEADWTSATFASEAGDPYSFRAEGVVQSLGSTGAAPSAVLIKDGQGLFSDPATCALRPDVVPTSSDPATPEFYMRWVNPLAAALKDASLVSGIAPGVVSGVPRCLMHLVPLQPSTDPYSVLDQAIMKYGADWRSQKFMAIANYEAQIKKLTDTKVAAQAALVVAKADGDAAQAEHDTVEHVQLPQMQTDLTAAQNVQATCTNTTLVSAQQASSAATEQISACKTELSAIPDTTTVADATVAAVTKSLSITPFNALPVECIVAKAAYHTAYPDVLAAGKDAWVHYATVGKGKGNAWTGGDSCKGTASGIDDDVGTMHQKKDGSGEFTNVRYYTTDKGKVCLNYGDSVDLLSYFTAGKRLWIHDLVAAGDSPSSTANDRLLLTVTGSTNDETGAFTCLNFKPDATFPPDQVATFTESLLKKGAAGDNALAKPPYDMCKWTPERQVVVGNGQGNWWSGIAPFGGAPNIPAVWISYMWGNAPVGKTATYIFDYYLDESEPITAQLKAWFDNSGEIYVDTKQVVGVWDGNTPNDITLRPGLNSIVVGNHNDGGPMGCILAVVYNGKYLFGTGPEWMTGPDGNPPNTFRAI